MTGLLALLDELAVQQSTIPAVGADGLARTIVYSAFMANLLAATDAGALLLGVGAAPLNSPAFTGTPTVPNQTAGNNSQRIANTAYVDAAIATLLASAPAALDTLNELAAALGNDPNFATTVTNAIALKAPINSPGLTGTPTAPTVAGTTDNTTKLATTAFVQAVAALLAPLASPALTGNPTAPTQAANNNSTRLATTAYVDTADALKAPLASPALTGNPTAPTQTAGDNTTKLATTAFVRGELSALSVPRGHISGLTMSTPGASNTITVQPGVASDSLGTTTIALLAALSKTTSPWGLGNNAGGLDAGVSVATNTWYHWFVILRPDTGATEVCFSTALAPNLTTGNVPAAYTKYRRIGSAKTDGSSQWVKFIQFGDDFLWDQLVQDGTPTVGTAATLATLSVPPGIQVEAFIQGLFVNGTAGTFILMTSPDQADSVPSITNFSLVTGVGAENYSYDLRVRTNLARQVRVRSSAVNSTVYFNTYGWRDRRGRD